MLNKIKKTFYADDFSYFIRYFGLFTLIFSAMTLIIIQVMRSSLYTSVDENLKNLSNDPSSVADLAYRTTGQQSNPSNKVNTKSPKSSKEPDGDPNEETKPDNLTTPNFSSNTFALLLDDNYKNISTSKSDGFLDFNSLDFNKSYLNQIKEIVIGNSFGQTESYRAYLFDIDPNNEYPDIKYAVVMTSISQLEQTSGKHEQLIAMVMVSFWGISLIASIYLARMSVKPLLESIQKQKAFVENASHELRTPVAVAEGALDNARLLAQRGYTRKVYEALQEAHRQVVFLARMINDLGTLSRTERGLADAPEVIDLIPLVKQLHETYAPQAAAKPLAFNLDIDPQAGSVYVSRLYLEELLQNFITNAIKYTPRGAITLIVRRQQTHVTISVKDTGIGIGKSDLNKIFDRFYRAEDYRTRQTSGTGLGLYIAHKLAQKLETTIHVTSRLNHGSIFSFTLPIYH